MSQVPRPYRRPSRRVTVKGSEVQGWPSTGTTSVWPDSTMPPSTIGPMVANRLVLVPSSLGTRRPDIPSLANSASTNAINGRLEPREVVSKATSLARMSMLRVARASMSTMDGSLA